MKYLKPVIITAMAVSLLAVPAFARGKKTTSAKNTSSQVIFTGDLAKDVYGYNGTTPLNIHISNGKITKIEALPNNETPSYFKRAINKIFPQYVGKTVAEAKKIKVDAVTGATYSSEAVIKNIQRGLGKASATGGKQAKKK